MLELINALEHDVRKIASTALCRHLVTVLCATLIFLSLALPRFTVVSRPNLRLKLGFYLQNTVSFSGVIVCGL